MNILRDEFKFLEKDYEYKVVKEEVKDYYKGKNLLIYRNEKAEKQIEINADLSFIHCIIRKILNGRLSEYSNRIYNIGFEDLAMIDNPQYDHFDFYAVGKQGIEGVAKSTVELFRRQKVFLTTKQWIDINTIERLKNEQLSSRFRRVFNNKPEFFIEKVKVMVDENFPDFKLKFYNQELPFYHNDSTLEKLVYDFEDSQVKIEQYDWRDYREIYTVFQNDKKIREVDVSKFKNDEKAVREIKTACNNVYSP